MVRVGCEVNTSWGWGILKEFDATNGRCVVELDWESTSFSLNRPVLYTSLSEIRAQSFCGIGECVLTKYGIGVLIEYRRYDMMHVLRMPHNATAFMVYDEIKKVVAGDVDFEVSTPNGAGKIVRYRVDVDTYDVELPDGIVHFVGDNQLVCWRSKILPCSVLLMASIGPNLTLLQSRLASFSSLYERIRIGSISAESAMAEIMNISTADDFVEFTRKHWEANKISVSENLEAMKGRIVQLIRDTDVASVTINTENFSNFLDRKEALRAGKLQIEQLLTQFSSAEWNEGTDRSGSDASDISTLDLQQSLSNVYSIAQNDPAMESLTAGLNSTYMSLQNSLQEATSVFIHSKSGQILGSGGERLRSRVENLLVTARDRNEVSAQGSEVQTSSGPSMQAVVDAMGRKMGSAKNRGALDRLKDSFLSTVTQISFVSDSKDGVTTDPSNEAAVARWFSLLFSRADEQVFNYILGDEFVKKIISACISGSQTLSQSHFRSLVEERLCDLLVTAIMTVNQASSLIPNSLFPSGLEIKRMFENPVQALATSKRLRELATSKRLRELAVDQIGAFKGMSVPVDVSENILATLGPIAEMFTKIGNGEMVSMQSAVGAMKSSLDSDSLEHAAKRLVEAGDKVVDTIESLRGLDSVQMAIGHITKFDASSTLMATIESVDADGAIAMAEAALHDTTARLQLIEMIKTHVIDFLSQYLPTLSIPPLSGVSDDVEYSISGLDMSGFKLNKNGIFVQFSDDLSTSELLSFKATGINARFAGISWSYKQLFFPHLSGNGVADANVQNASIDIAFRVVRVPKGAAQIMASSLVLPQKIKVLGEKFPGLQAYVDRIRDWLMEGDPTYEPGAVSLQTVLNTPVGKRAAAILWGDAALLDEWEPVLVISTKKITIESLELQTDSSTSMAWLYNLFAGVFSSVIKEYVCTQLESSLVDKSAQLLGMVNGLVGEHWPMMQRFIQLPVNSLPLSTGSELCTLCSGWTGDSEIGSEHKISRDYVLKFTEPGSVGLKVDILRKSDTQPSDRLLVIGIVPKSQAQTVVAELKLDMRALKNALIRSVNSKNLIGLSAEEGLGELRGPRPLYVGIRLSDEGFKFLQRSTQTSESKRKLSALRVEFVSGSLGLRLKETKSCGGAVIIAGFVRGAGGELLQAESKGCLKIGMIMLAVGDEIVFGKSFNEVMQVLTAASRPVRILFAPSPDSQAAFTVFPHDLVMHKVESSVIVSSTYVVTPSVDSAAVAATAAAVLGSASSAVGSSSVVAAAAVGNGAAVVPIEIRPGSVIIQVNKTLVTPEHTVRSVVDLIKENLPTTKVAFRDMDAFMHLIRIRDGTESVANDVDATDIQ